MAAVFGEVQWCSSPVAYWKCDYNSSRSGANVTYDFTFTVRFTGAYTWYNDGLGVTLTLDGTSKGQKQIKAQTSGQIGAKSYTLNWTETISKTSGDVSFSASIKNTNQNTVRNTQTKNIPSPAAGSSMGSVTAGSTLNGPTINVTRYDSSFTDNITLSYNGYTIPRNNFTSGKLTFSEAERLSIFQAQGAGQTKSWSISGNTYSGSTWLGSYSGSVNITTEALSNVTAAANFNVESNTTYSTSNACGGGTKVIAYVGGYGTSGSTSVFDSGIFTGTKSSATATMAASTIYNSNISTQDGTIYWCTYSYIKDASNNWQHIGTVNSRTCTYYFVQSLCGPSMTSLQYKVTDAGTKTLMGASGSYYNYNDNTDLGKFIRNKTTLNISYGASAKSNKGTGLAIKKYIVSVTGKSDVDKGTNTTADISALPSAGTVTVTAYDSRNYPTSLSFSYGINEYWAPTFSSLTAVRNPMSATYPNNDKIVTITAEISLPTYMANYVKNNAGSSYYLKYTASPSVSDNTNLLSNCTVGTNKLTLSYVTGELFNQSTQYTLYLKITDYYSVQASANPYQSGNVTIPISAPLISRRSQKVGINKIPGSYTLDVGGTFGCSGNATIGGNASVSGIITSRGKQLQSYFSINLSSQSTSNFYPVTFLPESEELECEIHSPGFGGSAAYNQNIIHFIVSSSGWSDTPVYINVLNYKNYTDTEITIGCIGKGNSSSYEVCVWLRGGFTYNFYSNFTPTLHTSNYTGGGSSPSTFTVGTNYYGGSNTNVTILFTPQSTITKGSYQSENITAGGTVTAGTDIKANSGFLYSVNNGVTTKIGGGNSSFTHYYSTSGKHWFDHPVYVAGDIYGGSSYNKKVAYYEQIPTNTNQLTNGAGFITGYASTGTSTKSDGDCNSITWTYIKFTNGYAVCWGDVSFNCNMSDWGGKGYLSPVKTPPSFPFTFSSRPSVLKSVTNIGSNDTYSSAITGASGSGNGPTTTFPGKFHLFRASSPGGSRDYSVSIMAFGKWN